MGRGIKRAHPTDKRSEEHMTPVVPVEKPSVGVKHLHSGRPSYNSAELERAYEAWLHSYLNQPGRVWGVYDPTETALVVRVFSEPADKGRIFKCMRSLLKHYTFYPRTPIPSQTRFVSDEEAVLNDWAIVGGDLYGAIQQYRINSPLVRTDTETDEPATAAR